MKKIIIFGSNGMLGAYLTKYLSNNYEVIPLTRKDLDISKSSDNEILDFLMKNVSNNDIIINACGVIKQREYDVVSMIKVNSLFPHLLGKIKEDIGCKVIHITTDCVFSGQRGLYTESDLHDCIDDYGKSKSLGECENITNIRTSIIGEELYNKKSLLEWAISNKDKEVNGFKNHLWNGVTCLELSKLIEDIILNNKYWLGTRHIFSPDTKSKYDLLKTINDIYNLNLNIVEYYSNTDCFRNLYSNYNDLVVNKTLDEQILEMYNFNIK